MSKIIKKLITLSLFIFLIFIKENIALAGYGCASGGKANTLTLNFGTITVDASAPVGSVLAEKTVSNMTSSPGFPCTPPELVSFNMLYGTYYGGPSGYVYKTNVPGVGIQGKYSFNDANVFWTGYFNSNGNGAGPTSGFRTLVNLGDTTWQLIKIGDMESGLLEPGSLATADAGVILGYYNIAASNIVLPTCDVQSSQLNVSLGTWQTSDFTGPGSTSDTVPIGLKLSCPSTGTRVRVTITADADTSQAGTLKINAGSGTATGVGIQMLNKSGNPLQLNKQFQVSSSAAGNFNPGWNARYIQTGSTVTAGKANGDATATFNYN